MTKFNKTLLAAAITLASTQTFAAGFQLNSQSATGLGRAMAGDAVIADNASVLARNPAAMALFDSTTVSVGATYADVKVEVTDVQYGDTHLGSLDNAASGKFIPNGYFIMPVNDKFAFGFGAFSNYGTGTDLSPLNANQDVNTPIDLLGNTEVTTVNLNASVSYRINDALSLGAGIDIIRGSGKLTRNGEVNLGQGAMPINLVDVDADGYAFGGILGLTYEFNDDNRIGLSYRFSPTMKASGDIMYNPLLVAPENFDEIEIPMADIAQLAGYHKLTDKFAIHYTAQWTQWSAFDKISVTGGDGLVGEAAIKQYNWKDSWFLSVGGTYELSDNWTLRAGIASDQGVVGEISSLSIPDSDRMWYSVGASYHINDKSSIDLGYTLVKGEKVHVIETSALVGQTSAYTESGANYFGLQYSHSF
ncbi:transporter [Shewanella maritima]|uniref:Transporter n=1 Tax=Shewanella maritima TaxID=2520507 RepID=A0A411PKP2_9GAMM|nr:outer membrane protein transport protein [Shewanella maritima]QBF84085.1 transporter [Shewanella maritima]